MSPGYRDDIMPKPGEPGDDWRRDPVGRPTAMTVLWIILAIVGLLAFGLLGAIIEGLLWLTLIAAIIFVVGAVFGYVRFRGSSNA
jgi:FtsH-binding integral membrane protein